MHTEEFFILLQAAYKGQEMRAIALITYAYWVKGCSVGMTLYFAFLFMWISKLPLKLIGKCVCVCV